MGMFDTMALKTKCPACGVEGQYYQTKDLDCTLRDDVRPDEVDEFYGGGCWAPGFLRGGATPSPCQQVWHRYVRATSDDAIRLVREGHEAIAPSPVPGFILLDFTPSVGGDALQGSDGAEEKSAADPGAAPEQEPGA